MARRRRRAQWLSAWLAMTAATCAAAPTPAAVAPVTAPAAAAGPAAPSAELLLYLGEFEDADGDWIDPLDLPSGDAPAAAGEDDDAP